MSKYFQGIVEINLRNQDGEIEFTEIFYIKEDFCRIESTLTEPFPVEIIDTNHTYSINNTTRQILERKRQPEFLLKEVSVTKTNKTSEVNGFHCHIYEIAISYEFKDDSFKSIQKHFINEKFKVHPNLKYQSSLFLSGYIPLRTICHIDDDPKLAEWNVQITEEVIPPHVFDIKSFIIKGFKIIDYDEYHKLEEIQRQKERQRKEREWEEWQKKIEEEQIKNIPIYNKLYKPMVDIMKRLNIGIPVEIENEPHLAAHFVLQLDEELKDEVLKEYLKVFPLSV